MAPHNTSLQWTHGNGAPLCVMNARIGNVVGFLLELEKLKLVERRTYVSDLTRRENAAEHSWHVAVGLLTVARELRLEIDLPKAMRLALVHDVCEIDPGDVSVYSPRHAEKQDAERRCVERLAAYPVIFGEEIAALWREYEQQETLESRWVRVVDRLLPFVVNLATEGQTWREQDIARSQVLRVNEPISCHAPEIYAWLVNEVERCVEKGWLRDA